MALASSMMLWIMPMTPPDCLFLLAVFASPLHLNLHLSNLGFEAVEVGSELLDVHFQVLNACQELLLLAGLLLSCELVAVEFLNAEVLVLDLISLLLGEGSNHVVDGLLDLFESIKTDLQCQGRQCLVVRVGSSLPQHSCCISATGRLMR